MAHWSTSPFAGSDESEVGFSLVVVALMLRFLAGGGVNLYSFFDDGVVVLRL